MGGGDLNNEGNRTFSESLRQNVAMVCEERKREPTLGKRLEGMESLRAEPRFDARRRPCPGESRKDPCDVMSQENRPEISYEKRDRAKRGGSIK